MERKQKNFIGFKEAIVYISQKINKNKKRYFLIGIDGGTASGKSTFSKKIKKKYPKSAVIKVDNYCIGKTAVRALEGRKSVINWERPFTRDLARLKKDLEQLISEGRTIIPIYSPKRDEPLKNCMVRATRVIIVEGIFALDKILRNSYDLRIFIESGSLVRRCRRIYRDSKICGTNKLEIVSYFDHVICPMHMLNIQPNKIFSDVVIHND